MKSFTNTFYFPQTNQKLFKNGPTFMFPHKQAGIFVTSAHFSHKRVLLSSGHSVTSGNFSAGICTSGHLVTNGHFSDKRYFFFRRLGLDYLV